MTEAALVMIPLLFFLLLAPGIAQIWENELIARQEAHRDMFDKTTTLLLLTEADADPPVSTHFGDISVANRRRALPGFPPPLSSLSPNPTALIDSPDGLQVTLGPRVVELFPDGFPNQFVEGWKYRDFEYRGGWWRGRMQLMRYGALVRSPWTWMGWPFVPTQDVYFEPRQVRAWFADQTVDDQVRKQLKLQE